MGCVLSTCCESHWKNASCQSRFTFLPDCCRINYNEGQENDGTSTAHCQVNFTAEHQKDATSTRRCEVNFTAQYQRERGQREQSHEQQRINEKTPQQERQALEQEKCYNPQDSTFKFVDREDEMDCEFSSEYL